LADLIGVRTPSLVRNDPGTADCRTQQVGKRFDRGEAVLGTDTSAAAHDDRRGGEREPFRNLHPIDDAGAPRIGAEHRVHSVTGEIGGAGASASPANACSAQLRIGSAR
jgi:hypothetical protein